MLPEMVEVARAMVEAARAGVARAMAEVGTEMAEVAKEMVEAVMAMVVVVMAAVARVVAVVATAVEASSGDMKVVMEVAAQPNGMRDSAHAGEWVQMPVRDDPQCVPIHHQG